MSDEPFSQDAEQRERRPILGIILILLLLFLLLGGFFLIRNSLMNPLTGTEEPAVSTATNTPTNTPQGESTEELTSQPTEPPTEPPPTSESTEPPPTDEGPTCKATGRYCSCAGVSYSVVTCSDGSRTDTPIGSCTPDPGLCGNDNIPTEPPPTQENCVTYKYCTCQGFVQENIFCNGVKTSDRMTTDQCTPDPVECKPPDQNPPPNCKPTGYPSCKCEAPSLYVCRDSCGTVTYSDPYAGFCP